MITNNYHSTGHQGRGSAYYTLAGFGNNAAATANYKQKSTAARNHSSRSLRDRTTSMDSKDSSKGSLAYSTASSFQSAGESTGSIEISDTMRMLEIEDKSELHSTTSSLNYSSTDESSKQPSGRRRRQFSSASSQYLSDESHLVGSEWIHESKKASLLGVYDDESDFEGEPFDLLWDEPLSQTPQKIDPRPTRHFSHRTQFQEPETPLYQKKTEATHPSTKFSTRTRYNDKPAGDFKNDAEIGENFSVSSQKQRSVTSLSSPKRNKRNIHNNSPRGIQDEFTGWGICSGEINIEDAIPESVPRRLDDFKAFVQPFLCGVI